MPELFEQCGWTGPSLPSSCLSRCGRVTPLVHQQGVYLTEDGQLTDRLSGGRRRTGSTSFSSRSTTGEHKVVPEGAGISRRFHKNMERQSKSGTATLFDCLILRYIPRGPSLAPSGQFTLAPGNDIIQFYSVAISALSAAALRRLRSETRLRACSSGDGTPLQEGF